MSTKKKLDLQAISDELFEINETHELLKRRVMLKENFNKGSSKTRVPEPDQKAILFGINQLHVSAALNSRRQARKCIKHKSMDVDDRDDGGNTALHYAARYNNTGMINWLCKHGANVHIQNNHGQNPLQYAYQVYAFKAIKALRKHGASTKIKDINGVVPAATKRLRTKDKAPIPLLAGLAELSAK